NLKNGQSVVVRINDRGGFRRHGRILDLSPAAARALSMTGAGVARVGLKRVGGDS
ncbi:MAG TPA: septal ring lytic transglycosylase RlpA family protein, partial [Plasticicumulans sp.]|nr:septal ring lytic transglycosylase RlpA family protein [Plasticicumulans sp.]